jgi:hypothetical protein
MLRKNENFIDENGSHQHSDTRDLPNVCHRSPFLIIIRPICPADPIPVACRSRPGSDARRMRFAVGHPLEIAEVVLIWRGAVPQSLKESAPMPKQHYFLTDDVVFQAAH